MPALKRTNYDFSVFPSYPPGFNNLKALRPLPKGAYEAFATRNGLTYTPTRSYDNTWPHLRDFGILLTGKIMYQFDGIHNNTPYAVACERETYQGGYGARAVYTTLVVIPLPKHLPQIALCSLLPHGGGKAGIGDWPLQYHTSQRLMSGDRLFDEYWAAYVPTAYAQATAEGLLTPQFINVLLQYAPNFDIGIIGDQLFILTGSRVKFREDFTALFTAVEAIIDALSSLPNLPEAAPGDTVTNTKLLTRHGNLRFFGRAVLVTLAVIPFLGMGLAHLMGYNITGSSIGISLLVAIIMLIAFFIIGPDKQLPKPPKDSKALLERFGEINITP
jgi:hypothetical protein